MVDKQLQRVADWERDKEQVCARDFQIAQQQVQQEEQKLSGLEQYRLEYLRMAHQKASDGMGALHFTQHQSFIAKLDKACEQQMQLLGNARGAAEQRKGLWLQQQRKRKAVEHLIEQKRQLAARKADKQEQQAMDEIALQKFIRQKSA